MPTRLLLILLLTAGRVLGQPGAAEWAAFTNMGDIEDILVQDTDVWSATSGGVLHFDRLQRRYERFTALDGLAGNQLFAVASDTSGALWFGTDGRGLSRFDPRTSTFDPPVLDFRDLRVTALQAAGDRLYVGTSHGISVFLLDKEEVKETYRRLGNLPKDAQVNALAIHADVLFAATADGLAWARLDQPNLQDPDSWSSMPNTGPVADLVVADAGVHAGSVLGVFTYDPVVDGFYHDFTKEGVTALGTFVDGVLAATEGGSFMRRLDREKWQRIGAPVALNVRAVSRTDLPFAFVGTARGMVTVGPRAPSLPASGEPGSSRFYEILVGDGEVWATSVPDDQQRTLSAGAYQLVDGSWTVYGRSTGMPNDELVALERDTQGRVWIGTWGGGAMLHDASGTWIQVGPRNSVLRGIPLAPDFVVVSDIHRDAEGNLWFLNELAGMAVLDGFPPQRQLFIDQVAGGLLPAVDFYRLAIGPDGLKWIASRTDGLVLFDDGGTPYDAGDDRFIDVNRAAEPRLSSDRVFAVHVGPDGRVWMGTDNGLDVLTPDYDRDRGELRRPAWRTYTTFDGLLSAEINAVESDDEGNLWVGTEHGLSRIGTDGEVDFTLTASNSGLIDNRVKGLTFDTATGDLWIGTFDGLNRLRLTGGQDDGSSGSEGYNVFPNPFRTGGRRQLTFTGLPLGAALRIFTAAGDRVAVLRADAGRGTVTWDGLNDGGFRVATGVYLFVAEGEDGARRRGRFAVVNGSR